MPHHRRASAFDSSAIQHELPRLRRYVAKAVWLVLQYLTIEVVPIAKNICCFSAFNDAGHVVDRARPVRNHSA